LITKDANKLYILNSTDGEACGVIRAIRVAAHGMPSADQFEQAIREDIAI
jgi:hypothetical protein